MFTSLQKLRYFRQTFFFFFEMIEILSEISRGSKQYYIYDSWDVGRDEKFRSSKFMANAWAT